MSLLVSKHCRGTFLLIALICIYQKSYCQLTAKFSASVTSGCAPIVVQFSDQSTGSPSQWKWDLGNGVVSTLQNPSTTYFNAGVYHVKLIVRNATGADSVIKNSLISVYPNPVVGFSASDTTGCFPLSVQFKDATTNASGNTTQWNWDFGDGSLSSLQDPVHTYRSSGSFSVTLKATNSFGCFKAITKTQYIKTSNGVKADFTINNPGKCQAPVTFDFANTSTGPDKLSFSWDFGDGSKSSETNPSHTYTAPGSYTVTLIAISNQGCSDTIKKQNFIVIGNIEQSITIPDVICAGRPVVFRNSTTPKPVNVRWNFGDGTTSVDTTPIKIYTTPGVYQIKLVNYLGGCTDSIIKSITVLKRAKPEFAAIETKSCKIPFIASFKNTTAGTNTYHWDFGDGTTSEEANPSHSYNAYGNYTVRLIVTNEAGCNDTLVKEHYIQIQAPVITLNGLPKTGCNPLTINPTATVASSEAVANYQWDFGDGTTSAVPTPSHIYTKAGNYKITLTITTNSGCVQTITMPDAVRVGDKPNANFVVSPGEICASDAAAFTDKSTGNVDQWLWDFGDTYTSNEQNPRHSFGGLGKFSVTLIAWSNTCPDTIRLVDVVDVKPPLALFNVLHSCTNKYKKDFVDHSVGAQSWFWDFGDGSTSAQQNPSHTYAAPGNYKVTLRVANDNCTNINWSIVKVIDEQALFVADKEEVCKGNTITFNTPAIKKENIANWQWSFGDGDFSNNQALASHIYGQSGKYIVSLSIVDSLGCADTKTKEIAVHGATANFTASASSACLSQSSIAFTDASVTDGSNQIIQWIWNFGDGVIDSSGQAPHPHQYNSAGEYNVSLKVVDAFGCSNSIIKNKAVIIAQPVAAFYSADSLSCTDKPIHFINQSTGYDLQYNWNLGDGNHAAVADPIHHYDQVGVYAIHLKVTDKYGCTDSVNKEKYIRISYPKASFSISDSVSTCPPLLVKFTNASSDYTHLSWDFGDGNSSALMNPEHYYNSAGTFYPKLIVTGPGGCVDSISKKIEVKGPSGSFSYVPKIGCKPLEVTFTAKTLNRSSLVWDFSDGTTITTQDSVITHTYTEAGEYLPKMILIDDNGCNVPILGSDPIKVVGIETSFESDKIKLCNDGYVRFTNTTVSNDLITSYEWEFGDGTKSNIQHPSHHYHSIATYTTQLIATTATGCKDTSIAVNNITVFEGPVISITSDSVACVPAKLFFAGNVLRGDEPSLQWMWQFGNGQSSTAKTPAEQHYVAAGNYNVSAWVVDKNGCADTARKNIIINPVPNTDAGADVLVCAGSFTQLNARGAVTYFWQASPELSCINCDKPIASPADSVVYVVTGYNQFGCAKADSVKVNVRHPFSLKYSDGDTICAGTPVHLWASGADQYLWTPAIGLDDATTTKPLAKPETTTTYLVTAKDRDNCFTQTANVTIKVNPIPKVDAGTGLTMAAGGSIQIRPTYSADVAYWRWTPGTSLSCVDCPSPTAAPKQTTKYFVQVKNEGGCVSTDDVTISVICNNGNLFIPNTFSPNQDGSNDVFYPRGSGIAMIRSLRIFNRWGEIVFERINFNANDPSAGWDGTFKGQKLSPDVYIYSCEVVCVNNEVLPYKGDITLLR